jgi:hypothetical protein
MKLVDMTGQRYGRLTVIRRDGFSNAWHTMWLCECDCGNTVRVERGNLVRGRTRSCGCLKHDKKDWRHGTATVGHEPETQ